MKIQRHIQERIQESIKPGVVTVLYGPRQVGKTTLLRDIQKVYPPEIVLDVNVDLIRHREIFSSQDERSMQSFLGEKKYVFIDEAQRIENIGLNLKILVDSMPHVAFVVTGSASLDLVNKMAEPLTGRKRVFWVYPFSFAELRDHFGKFETVSQLERWLRFGSYPKAVTLNSDADRELYVSEVVSSYLYRDVLEFSGIRKPKLVLNLLRLLAFQIGSEVSITELAGTLGASRDTVEKYLDLLEKSFVLYNVTGFSRNLRKEITKTSRYYFYDVGVRNALIENMNDLDVRNDAGMLWENYLAMERIKHHRNGGTSSNYYFWRTWDQKEIDWVEERGGKLCGYEFKWGNKLSKEPRDWRETYPEASYETVNRENFTQFLQ